MAYDPERHHRQSIRLRGFDYSSAGAYFITLCTQNRACLFGDIADGVMVLNSAGQMVDDWWVALNQKFLGIQTDASMVMPNHFHGIIIINPPSVGTDLRVCPEPGIGDATDREFFYRAHLRSFGIYAKIEEASTPVTMAYSSSLTDAEWEILEPLLPEVLPPKKNTRPLDWGARHLGDK